MHKIYSIIHYIERNCTAESVTASETTVNRMGPDATHTKQLRKRNVVKKVCGSLQ